MNTARHATPAAIFAHNILECRRPVMIYHPILLDSLPLTHKHLQLFIDKIAALYELGPCNVTGLASSPTNIADISSIDMELIYPALRNAAHGELVTSSSPSAILTSTARARFFIMNSLESLPPEHAPFPHFYALLTKHLRLELQIIAAFFDEIAADIPPTIESEFLNPEKFYGQEPAVVFSL